MFRPGTYKKLDLKTTRDVEYNESYINTRDRKTLNEFCFSNRTILLSVISLLNEPNTFSPANVDASVMYRRWRDSKGLDNEYENIIRYGNVGSVSSPVLLLFQ